MVWWFRVFIAPDVTCIQIVFFIQILPCHCISPKKKKVIIYLRCMPMLYLKLGLVFKKQIVHRLLQTDIAFPINPSKTSPVICAWNNKSKCYSIKLSSTNITTFYSNTQINISLTFSLYTHMRENHVGYTECPSKPRKNTIIMFNDTPLCEAWFNQPYLIMRKAQRYDTPMYN